MVQIIPEFRRPSLSDQFGEAFAGIGKTASEEIPQHFLNKRENKALSGLIGKDISDIRDPQMRQKFVDMALRKEEAAEKARLEELSLPDYETVKKQFGKDFADLYRISPTGGKTELLKAGLQALGRGEDISQMFSGMGDQEFESPEERTIEKPIPQLEKGKIAENFKFPDFTKRPKGFTAKEWADERKEWGKENAKLYEEGRGKIKAIDRDLLGTRKLKQLNESGKVAQDLSRLLINPSTGNFYSLAQLVGAVPEEAQEWAKEIARFGNRAKDAFGSRVTNFDLQQYMKQFPSLLNTPQGRKGILRMMQINYDLDRLYENARQQIYHKKGLTEIPPEEVDRLAREMIRDETERLENEFLGIDNQVANYSIREAKETGERPALEDIFG